MADPQGYQGYTSAQGDFNKIAFVVKQILAGVRIAQPVEVMAVRPNPATAGIFAGFVDVMLIVNQVDVAGNSTPHETINNIPYFRLVGGSNAVVLDPVVGDIGVMLCADRDISTVKANNGKPANPASNRRFDLADGMYFGGFSGEEATQLIRFASDGIHVTTPNKIFLEGDVEVTGTLTATGNITAGQGGGDQVTLQTHKHPTAATGSPSSPTPGT